MWEKLIKIFAGKQGTVHDCRRAVKFTPDGYNSWTIVWADDPAGYWNRPGAQKSLNCTDLSHKIFDPESRLSTRSVTVIWNDHFIKEAYGMKRNRTVSIKSNNKSN